MGLADILNPDKDAQAAAKYLAPILDNLTGELKVMLHEGIAQLGVEAQAAIGKLANESRTDLVEVEALLEKATDNLAAKLKGVGVGLIDHICDRLAGAIQGTLVKKS